MRSACLAFVILIGLCAASCQEPPPESLVGGARRDSRSLDLGRNAAGEACTMIQGPSDASVYCGAYVEAAGRVTRQGTDTSLPDLVSNSAWRRSLDQRFVCGTPVSTSILGAPAYTITCTRRQGGWPHVVIATRLDDAIYVADGVRPTEAVLPRAIAVMAGRQPAVAANATDSSGLATQRQAAQAINVDGVAAFAEVEFQSARGAMENRRGNYAAAEAAYRAAVQIQEKAVGRDNPALALPLARQALQVSNQGRFLEADRLLVRAEALVNLPSQVDPVAQPTVAYLRGLNLINRNQPEQALALLDTADARFAALLPRDLLTQRARSGAASRSAVEQMADAAADAAATANQITSDALNGLIETRRYRVVALLAMGRTADAEAALAKARDLYANRDPRLLARYLRTSGMTVAASGDPERAASELGAAASTFARTLPGSMPLAETLLLQATELVTAGRPEAALSICRAATETLRALQTGLPANRFVPCLLSFSTAGGKDPTLTEEMFELSQLAQGTITTRQIARATARLIEGAKDSKVAQAMRSRDQIATQLDMLYQRRAELAVDRSKAADLAATDEEIRRLREAVRDASQAVQAAAPRLSGLVQEAVSLPAVQAVLGPREALAAIVLGDTTGWTFLIRRDAIQVGTITGGASRVDPLVKRIRASMELGPDNRPPPFDASAARELYAAVLGPVSAGLADISQLTVSASGSLLSVPFNLLLTDAGSNDDPARMPFLVRRMAVSHVPSVGGFVNLRTSAKSVRANRPWFGFGDFRPPSATQALATFPPSSCGESARLLTSLSPLPGARRELEAARLVLGADPRDQLTGSAFTAPGVLATPLTDYRTLHFATHALLPSELRCQAEPAILTSTPPAAPDARGAMLTASQIEQMDLDADLVILAACNTGGEGGGAGESLSGLARSFLFAGTRALLVTHWDANDVTTTYLTALFLQGLRNDPGAGPAAALAAAQRRMLDESVGARAAQAHPYYWAVAAMVGGSSAQNAGPAPAIPVSANDDRVRL